MAVTKMKLVRIMGKLDMLDSAIESCCDSNQFHLDYAMSFFPAAQGFVPINEENPYTAYLEKLKETAATATPAVEPTENPSESYSIDEITEYLSVLSDKIDDLKIEKAALTEQRSNLADSSEQLGHFKGLELDLKDIFECKYIKVRFGRLPKESLEKMKYYSDNPYVIYFSCTDDGKYVWGVYFAPLENVAEVDRIFASLYFERFHIPNVSGTVEQAIQEINTQISEIDKNLSVVDGKLGDIWQVEREKCESFLGFLIHRTDCFDLRKYAVKFKDSFALAGWIPKNKEKVVSEALDKLNGLEYSFENAEDEEEYSPPVKLKNAKPFRPFEYYVGMYGLPSYKEVDPTPFVAVTYFMIFGIMFGDLGQGLVLSLIGWFFMWKLKKMPLGKIIAMCGISSAVFGFIFGSVFGFEEALNPMWTALGFNFEHGKPIEVMASTMTIIAAAVGIGVLLLICAMLINIYSSLKQKRYGAALFGSNGVAGLVFYASVLVGGVLQLLMGVKVFTAPYIIFLIILPIIVLFFAEPLGELIEGKKNWMPEKMGEFFIQSFFEVFEYVLSYISNTLSFMRVGAFVFVHTGMMQVVMTLAGVSDGGPLTVGSVIILVIGNIFVMGLEGLLVGIQSLRLEFYEMFSRFFDGSGRPFVPVSIGKAKQAD